MYMANLRFLVCCHELFSTPTKTKDLCSFILNSLVDTVTGWVSSITVQTVRGDGTWCLYVTTLIAMPWPGWIHNDVGYHHISGNKNIIFDMGHMDIE